MNTELNYGYKIVDGKKCGFATYVDPKNNDTIEIVSIPYGALLTYCNGESVPVSKTNAYIWTMVSGWLGTAELAALNQVSKGV